MKSDPCYKRWPAKLSRRRNHANVFFDAAHQDGIAAVDRESWSMGLFHFVASAGRVLGGQRTTHQDASRPTPKAPTGNAILNEFKKLGLAQLGGLNVTVHNRTATVTARAPDAETREKAILAAGNIAGIEAVQANISVPEPAPQPTFHTVQDGETLAEIAEAHLGDADAHPVLAEANEPILHQPGEVYPGQVIRIPDQGDAKA